MVMSCCACYFQTLVVFFPLRGDARPAESSESISDSATPLYFFFSIYFDVEISLTDPPPPLILSSPL